MELQLVAPEQQILTRPSRRSAVARESRPQKQPIQAKIFEQIKPRSIEFNRARTDYLYVITADETVCCQVSLNVTKTLYKLMCLDSFYFKLALANTVFSQVIRLYLMVNLWEIVITNKGDEEFTSLFSVALFFSRLLYFLTIFRAGLVQSKRGSLEIVIKSYLKGEIQTEEDELFFEITRNDLVSSTYMALIPAEFVFLVLPKHNKPELKRIYILLNFIQEALDLVFFLPSFVCLFVIFAEDDRFAFNSLYEMFSVTIACIEFARVMLFNIYLIIKGNISVTSKE